MSHLNIRDLQNVINDKQLKRLKKYDEVLQKCHRRITYNSKLDRAYCFFQIPEFIFGMPLYDIQELREYVINSLTNNGFKILYIDPNWLFIHWDIKGAKVLITNGAKDNNRKKLPDATKNYRKIDTYKPSGLLGSHVYDPTQMLGFSDKFK